MATTKTKPPAEPVANAEPEALPQTGGCFVRQPDGQLQPAPAEPTETPQE
jgi:hypothetical protein